MIIHNEDELTAKIIETKNIQRIVHNEKEIWGGTNKTIYLGYAQQFDIKNFYEDWQNLTINDFFLTPSEGDLHTAQVFCPWDGSKCTGCKENTCSVNFSKSYDASNGIFKCYFGHGGGNVKAWLIPNSAELIEKGKIVSLGSGQSFNVSQYADFDKATKDNFLVRTLNNCSSSFSCCSYQCGNHVGFSKSYNHETGILEMHSYVRRTLSGSLNTSPFYISPKIMKE